MKIGILTFYRAHNYGAMLQAFALCRTLLGFGHDVEFVDYRQPNIEDAFRLFSFTPYRHSSPINMVKIFIFRTLTFCRRKKRYENFRKFGIKYLHHSNKYVSGIRFDSEYDILVFGSDQIWTTRFLKHFDPILWGEIDVQCRKKITYAPSMEMSVLTNEQQEFCKKHLSNFEFISVREDGMKKLLSSLTDKDIDVVIDPVFLRDKKEYEDLASGSKLKLPAHYILVYSIGNTSEVLNSIVNKVSIKLALPIYYLCSEVGMKLSENRLDTAGPEDFLKAFSGADFIVTTTFHGTAFSVLFEKPFYSLRKAGVSGRAESLLSKLKLEKTLISNEWEVSVIDYPKIDYIKVKERLDELRSDAIKYLEKALK